MGRLIVLEGIDGSGKGTQSEKLSASLTAKHGSENVRKISFPRYGTEGARAAEIYLKGEISSDPHEINAYAASSFFAVDRYVSYMTEWRDVYLRDGGIIIADRYTTANAVHQLTKLPRERWSEFLNWLTDYEWNKLSLPRPDAVIYLRISPDLSLSLIEERAKKESRNIDIHENRRFLTLSYEAGMYAADFLKWHIVECPSIETEQVFVCEASVVNNARPPIKNRVWDDVEREVAAIVDKVTK